MKEYFKLQHKILQRKWVDWGIPIIVGYLIIPFVFLFLSYFLFEKTEFAQYLFPLFALAMISKLSESKRNDFLKSVYRNQDYLWIRITENCLLALPFLIFMIYQKLFVL